MEALCVTEKVLTIGQAPEDLVTEKADGCLGAKPCCESRRDPGNSRDLGLPLQTQFGDQLEPPFGARLGKADDLSSLQNRLFSSTVRAIASSIRRAKSCQVKRRA